MSPTARQHQRSHPTGFATGYSPPRTPTAARPQAYRHQPPPPPLRPPSAFLPVSHWRSGTPFKEGVRLVTEVAPRGRDLWGESAASLLCPLSALWA